MSRTFISYQVRIRIRLHDWLNKCHTWMFVLSCVCACFFGAFWQTSELRVRKMDNPFMVSCLYLLDFFETKYSAWSSSLFDHLREKVGAALTCLLYTSPSPRD